jgi:hypothetical protein
VQASIIRVIAEKQGADVRSAAGRLAPAYDHELLAVKTFRLYPQATVTRRVWSVQALRYDAFKSQLTRMFSKARAVADNMVAEAQAPRLVAEQRVQPLFAFDEWQPSRALAFEIQKVERKEDQFFGPPFIHGRL